MPPTSFKKYLPFVVGLFLLVIPLSIGTYEEYTNHYKNRAWIDILIGWRWIHLFSTDVSCVYQDENNFSIDIQDDGYRVGLDQFPECKGPGFCRAMIISTAGLQLSNQQNFYTYRHLNLLKEYNVGTTYLSMQSSDQGFSHKRALVRASIRCAEWRKEK